MKKIVVVSLVLGLFVVAVICGCGSGGNSGNSTPQTVTLLSDSTMDGVVNSGGGISTLQSKDYIGDDAIANVTRGIISFSISSIPAGATVTMALLKIYQATPNDNGYALGPVIVDHITFTVFNTALYDKPALATISGSLATSFAEGWKQIDVSSSVQNDLLNARGNS